MSCYTSFTITQPFLGAPLQFTPALGSDEFELLIDCYVAGSASKQDKLSQVTIDFYNTATVDLNTGSLVKTYNVFPAWTGEAFEQSPTQSNSSGFSPAIYTPSPGSSVTLGDSAYGSMMTPSSRSATASGRVSKKAKKDTKKTAEARLPGFSIMTRDGVDVTSSAGRGTKTKEQREHAHLMRQLKACADCKRKKVRCDPSHRRSHTEMSRASTSNGSSSSRISPAASTPSIQEATSFSTTTNAFDDFILFPEDDMASWNPADLPMTDFASQDLSQFNWDINELDMNAFAPIAQDMDFGFPSYRQQSYSSQHQSPFSLPESLNQQPHDFQIADNIPGYAPLQSDQNSPDSWAEPQGYSTNAVVHTRPHSSSQFSSDQLGESWLLQGGNWNLGNLNVPAVKTQSVPGDSPRLDVPTNVPLARSQSIQNVASGVTPGELIHDGHTLHASLQAGDVVMRSNVQATSQGHNVPVSNVQSQSSLHLDSNVRLDSRQVVDRQSQSDPLFNRRDSESVRLDSRQHVSIDADQSLHIDVQLARNSPNANANVQAQSQQLGDWNFNELQLGSANTSQTQVSVQEPQSSEQQSVHCLNRQDQPQALEQASPVSVLMTSLSQHVQAVSSVVITVLNTILLSGLALTLFSGSGPLAWVRDACLQSVGTNDSWMVLARLALVGSLVVGLFPEMLTSTSTQTPGCFGLGHIASAALAFFSGSVSSSGSSSACRWESISTTLFNGCLDARPSPSKTHDQSWTANSRSSSSPSSFLLGLLEEITPATVGLV